MSGARGQHYKRLLEHAEEAVVPISVQIELTGRCNLHCSHCFLDIIHPPEELSVDQWTDVIDQLADLGTLFLSITGGEPFLRRDTFDIAEHARAAGMALTLLTAGTRFRDGDLDRIAAMHPLAVNISLYAANPSVHDAITRRPGSHKKTLASAVGLRQRGVPVILKTPILKPTIDEVQGIVDIAHRIGAEYTFDPTIITRRDGSSEPIELRPTREEVARVLALPALQASVFELPRPPRSADTPVCSIARRLAVIVPNGDVMPCTLHPEPAGNVTRESFADIWTRSPLLGALRATTMGSLDDACASCSQNDACGRCGALALLEDGDFLGPSRAACDLADARQLAAGLPLIQLGSGRHRSSTASPSEPRTARQ
ncbi:MAG: radical SAM protein [Myxococcota bacterium]